MADFIHRGVIEGFYGPPYAPADRLWLIERIAAWGMNRYVYAPKDDPLHRAQWRTPYGTEALADFAALINAGRAAGVEVGFAVSPGLTITYSSAEDASALQAKFRVFHDLGARFFCLALDDVPSRFLQAADEAAFASLGDAHAALAHKVAEAVGADSTLWVVPTDYVGVGSTDYLERLGRSLAPEIEVGWTGRTVLSPTITAAEAATRAAALGRRLLIWDNFPVADGPMRPMLHLGPYAGRDPDLAEHASGVLLNPMSQAHASAVALRTAADYLRDPRGYEPEAAWRAACAEAGTGAGEAFTVFAAAHRFSTLMPEDRDCKLEGAVAALRNQLAAGAARPPIAAVRALLDERVVAAETLRAELADRRLADEIEPWLTSHRGESERMAAAVELLDALCAERTAIQRVLAMFRFEGLLSRMAPSAATSYGPRRAFYPQLASLRDDTAAFGDDPVLFVGRCLADEVIAFAESVALERLVGRAR